MEYRRGELHLVHDQIADCGAERGFADREANHQAEGEAAADDALAELGALLAPLLVQVDRGGVAGGGGASG
jgi:hypothetical protein